MADIQKRCKKAKSIQMYCVVEPKRSCALSSSSTRSQINHLHASLDLGVTRFSHPQSYEEWDHFVLTSRNPSLFPLSFCSFPLSLAFHYLPVIVVGTWQYPRPGTKEGTKGLKQWQWHWHSSPDIAQHCSISSWSYHCPCALFEQHCAMWAGSIVRSTFASNRPFSPVPILNDGVQGGVDMCIYFSPILDCL